MSNLAPLVDQLLELKRQKAAIERDIDDIQLRFIESAEHELKKDGHKTLLGCSYTWNGTDGSIVRVNFPQDRLISSFQLDADGRYYRGQEVKILMPAVQRLDDPQFGKLFVTLYKPAKAFRELVPKILKPGPAAAVLEECTEPSSPRVTTEVAEVVP